MNCFNHRERAAVAVCKACGKGLCPDCLSQVGSSVACQGSCEKRVAVLDNLIDARLRILAFIPLYCSLLIASGLLFLIWGLLSYSADNAGGSFLAVLLGVLLSGAGVIASVRTRRLAKLK
jgi:hypothetical protein